MTRTELEARRLQAIPELIPGSLGKLARSLGVSRTTVYRWRTAYDNGSSLHQQKAPGRPPRLTHTHISACMVLYDLGPRASGFDGERWTQDRFAKVIHDVSGVEYDPDHVGKLMRRWGLRLKREKREAE